VDFLYRWRRPLVAVLAIMVLAAILSYTARLRGAVVTLNGLLTTVTTPVAGILSGAGNAAGTVTGSLSQLFSLEQEVARLKTEVQLLHSMRLELEEVEADNRELRGLLYLKQSLGSRWKTVVATVVARNPDTWFATVVLDEGSRAGIRTGMPVLVPQGAVGRIVAVTPDASTVMLLTDPESGVGAMDVRSQAAGVLLGQVNGSGDLSFQLFSHHPDVQVGDAVVTSGYSQYYPQGLLLGEVVSVAPSQFGLSEVAKVAPAVDFNQLNAVLVVESYPKGAAVPPITLGHS
jgi:rod shape-determining protein MreC